MKKKMFMAVILALFVSPLAMAGEGNVLNVSGMLDDVAAVSDGNPETFATLGRNSPDEPFVLYIYLAEMMVLDEVVISADTALDGESVELGRSLDVVNWEDSKFRYSAVEESGRYKSVFQMEAAGPAQYLRVRFNSKEKDAVEIKLYEISAGKKDVGENGIENVRIVDITKHTAAIEYTTVVATTSQVRYSPWRPDMNNVLIDQRVRTEHRLEMDGLLEGTEYYIQALIPKDEVFSGIHKFRTEGKPLPIILNINLDEIEPARARLILTGNTGLNWKLYYGKYDGMMDAEAAKNSPDGKVSEMVGYETMHGFEMIGLKPRTRYYFLLKAEDDEGRETESDLHGFDTPSVNLALGKPVEGTFRNELDDSYITPSDNPIGRVTDGDETYFGGFAKSMSPSLYKQFVMVDLEEVVEVAEVVVVWSRLAIPEEYTVKVDDGDQEWETVLEVDADGKKTEVSVLERRSSRGDPLVDVTIPVNRKLRRVRLDAPMGVKMISKFDFKVAILAEIKAQAP